MEGVLFIPPDRPQRIAELVCDECGQFFRPHWVGDGAEQLCAECYEAQFPPLNATNGQKTRGNGHRL